MSNFTVPSIGVGADLPTTNPIFWSVTQTQVAVFRMFDGFICMYIIMARIQAGCLWILQNWTLEATNILTFCCWDYVIHYFIEICGVGCVFLLLCVSPSNFLLRSRHGTSFKAILVGWLKILGPCIEVFAHFVQVRSYFEHLKRWANPSMQALQADWRCRHPNPAILKWYPQSTWTMHINCPPPTWSLTY